MTPEEKNIEKKLAYDFEYKSHYEKYREDANVIIFVDKVTSIIKNYMISDIVPGFDGNYDVIEIGKVSKEVFALIIMCIDAATDSFPIYNRKTGTVGVCQLKVTGLNCILNENSSVWELNEGEMEYNFYVIAEDSSGCNTKFEGFYIKQQDKDASTSVINNKHSSKTILKNKSKFIINNLKGDQQTFKVKCTIQGEITYWLAQYITVK